MTAASIKTLMATAWVEIQMPHKISYTEEETSPRGAQAGYKLTFEFKIEISGAIREKLPVPFLWHVMQQAINLQKEYGPDIVKFMKYSGLYLMAAGHEEHRYEEVEGFIFE